MKSSISAGSRASSIGAPVILNASIIMVRAPKPTRWRKSAWFTGGGPSPFTEGARRGDGRAHVWTPLTPPPPTSPPFPTPPLPRPLAWGGGRRRGGGGAGGRAPGGGPLPAGGGPPAG